MHPYGRLTVLPACAASAFCLMLSLTGCGRGPVETFPQSSAPVVTIELFVQGQIAPSEGDYIVALSTNFDPVTNINQGLNNEQPGEPTIVEAYSNPTSFTNWDQAFVYGSNPHGLPNCPIAPQNLFEYCYKVITVIGGQTQVKFVPLTLTPNSYIFVPNANGPTGTNNAIDITLPINCFSNGGDQAQGSCGPSFTFNSQVLFLYLNFITLDNNGVPQDQLACLSQQIYTIDLSASNTQNLVKPPNCTTPPPPANQDLLITGGRIIVFVPGT